MHGACYHCCPLALFLVNLEAANLIVHFSKSGKMSIIMQILVEMRRLDMSYASWCDKLGLSFSTAIEPVVEEDPCNPNPCGPYSNPPRNNGNRCDCSCQAGMIGQPPNCRPECQLNSDCPMELACRAQKCVDPCPGLCGQNANCRVRNHIPLCVCNQGFIGDPFASCYRPTSKFLKPAANI